jgi:hypothetical protein
MQLDQVRTAVQTTPKGANIILEWVRPCKTRKGVQDAITKSVRMVGRIGVEYDNLKAVQEKRESGELPAENAGLPWGNWSEYPWLIEHKGQYYVRLYKGTSASVHPEAHFFRNGVEVEKESIAPLLLASELDDSKGETFTCKVENMTRIHAESEWIMLVVGQVEGQKIATAVPVPASVLATI